MTDPYCKCGIPHPPGHCQRDPNATLRDRIAGVMADTHSRGTTTFIELADAVIAELGLRQDLLGEAAGYPHPHTRYVTDWKADDDPA